MRRVDPRLVVASLLTVVALMTSGATALAVTAPSVSAASVGRGSHLTLARAMGGSARGHLFSPSLAGKQLTCDSAAIDFGSTVALSGTTAMVSHADGVVGGTVCVFEYSNGTWSLAQTLQDPSPSSIFGASMAVSGTTAIIGAPGNSFTPAAVYIYTESDRVWSLQDEIDDPLGQFPGDSFGRAVALSGTTALISGAGPVYVYTGSGGLWSQSAQLQGDVPADDAWGFSVALSGGTAVVGAPNGGDNDTFGYVEVFRESGGVWPLQTRFAAPSSSDDFYRFGSLVAVSGTTLLVGGSPVFVYHESGAQWRNTTDLQDPAANLADDFGTSLAVSGTTALIGAPGTNADAGAAYVFSELNGVWGERLGVPDPDAAGNDDFGYSVALSGTTEGLVGAPGAPNSDLPGFASLYSR